MIFRKSRNNEPIKEEPKVNCWTVHKNCMKLLSESLGTIGKATKEISSNSATIRKEIRNSNEVKTNELIDNTYAKLRTSLNRLNASSINIKGINKVLLEEPVYFPINLPN